MQKSFLLLLLFAATGATAQKSSSPKKYASSITAADMKKHLYIIAGKEMGGRNTPSPGLEKAAVYIEDHFKSFGLLPGNNGSYRQYYPLTKDSVESTSVTVNGTAFELVKDFQPNTRINHTATLQFSEVVFAGYGIVDKEKNLDPYKDVNVTGKLVMLLDGAPADYKSTARGFASPSNLFTKISNAQKQGAVAVLVVDKTFPRKGFISTGSYKLGGFEASLPPQTFQVSEAVAAKIMGDDSKNIYTAPAKVYNADVELGYVKSAKTENVSNVLGIIEGSDKKDEYVIVTAHYDHVGQRNDTTIYYGADDDGSGTTAILELAEAFAKAKAEGKGPRRTMIFMTVSGEEKGLWGSAYYANHPVFPLEKTSADLNIDMIGRVGEEYLGRKDSANYVYIIGDDKLSSELEPITNNANKIFKMTLDRKYTDPNDPNRFYYRSDHYNFAEKGVPVIFYFNGVHADYHQPTDTPDKINYPLMAKRTQFVFYTAWDMANRDNMLKRDRKLEAPPRAF